jgi:hypothetical protein
MLADADADADAVVERLSVSENSALQGAAGCASP